MIYNQQLRRRDDQLQSVRRDAEDLSSYQEVNHHGSVTRTAESLALSPPESPHDVEWFEHNSKSLTEEINLGSKPGGALDWIVGAFYLKSRTTVAYDQYTCSAANRRSTAPSPEPPVGARVHRGRPHECALASSSPMPSTTARCIFRISASRIAIRPGRQGTWHVRCRPVHRRRALYARHNTTWFDDYYDLFRRSRDFLRTDLGQADLARGPDYDVTARICCTAASPPASSRAAAIFRTAPRARRSAAAARSRPIRTASRTSSCRRPSRRSNWGSKNSLLDRS